jgi:hypothetical protein
MHTHPGSIVARLLPSSPTSLCQNYAYKPAFENSMGYGAASSAARRASARQQHKPLLRIERQSTCTRTKMSGKRTNDKTRGSGAWRLQRFPQMLTHPVRLTVLHRLQCHLIHLGDRRWRRCEDRGYLCGRQYLLCH